MIRLVLLTVLLGLIYYGGQRLWRFLAPRWTSEWRRLALAGGVLAVLVLVATGQLGLLLTAIGATGAYLARNLPRLLRWAPILQGWWRQVRTFVRFQGGAKAVETAWLRMHLDQASGAVAGTVLTGRFAGRQLQELGLDQLLMLFRELQNADAPSATLLESYLNLRYGDAWQHVSAKGHSGGKTAAPPDGKMRREEACKVLGVSSSATQKDIIAAHRRLMQKFHPDRGGSDHLATQINLAKDVLLKK